MSELSEILPKEKLLVMDLVKEAGIDVSDWGNFKGGLRKAACNPKYCYEWSFVQPEKVVVINLWYESTKDDGESMFQTFNYRQIANQYKDTPGKSVWKKRALKVDEAIQEAVNACLPVRVLVCDGSRRGVDKPNTEASRVERRLLDPIPWAVTAYDWSTGNCKLSRGLSPVKYIDQFSLLQDPDHPVQRIAVSGHAFVRSSEVRKRVLLRAGGRCEWCTQEGFLMKDGSIFLETHHIVPLSEAGPDIERNVAALCPNHHREAHHGLNSADIRKELLLRFSQ